MSSKTALTDAAARRAIVTELDRNMLVEAGAGSGKTHMMAARMAAGIASGAYQIEHLSAVTFTRKAAAELRGRFQLALEDELAGKSLVGRTIRSADDADRSVRNQHALSNLERLQQIVRTNCRDDRGWIRCGRHHPSRDSAVITAGP